MNAELYALTHRGNAGDSSFYRRVCRGADSVLELGSGSGRLLCALAGVRRRVIGLELDREMISLARRKLRALPALKRRSVRLKQGDMRRFSLDAPVERVLLPYNALFCMLNQRDALSCFRAARRALVLGGGLALDVWNAEPFQRASSVRPLTDAREPVVTFRYASRTWDVFERTRVRRAQQRLDAHYEYVPRAGGQSYEIAIAQRYYLADEIEALLVRAGFALQARFGDFSGGRFSPHSPQLILLASAI